MVLPDFEIHLKKYAHLIAKVGIGIRPGHIVSINSQIDQAKLTRLLVKELYALGAAEVLVNWTDDAVIRETYLHADERRLTTIPESWTKKLQEFIDEKVSRISINSSDPNVFEGINSERISKFIAAKNAASVDYSAAIGSNQISWSVIAAASYGWAKKVFPNLLTKEEQLDALWHQIFQTTRIYENDPMRAWEKHNKILHRQAKKLNVAQFDTLHYTAPVTDLWIGLPKHHFLEGAGSKNAQGEFFMANMPTEEVFTAPDMNRVNGYVV